MSESAGPFSKLRETLVDGRLANVFFRRDQLRQLKDALLKHKNALVDGIVKDSGNTLVEAFVELYLTLSAVKLYHDELKPDEQLEAEYRVANGRDDLDAQEGVGIVLIAPQKHTFVYSVIVPLAAAIAAGNCVVVVLEQTLLSLPSLVLTVLREALDRDIYETTQTRPQNLGNNFIQVIQTGDAGSEAQKVLVSRSNALVVAVVDRTANVEEAAKTLVDARMMFSGTSPYAPDVILVNEYAKKDFLNAAVRHSIKYMTEENGSATTKYKRLGGGEPKVNGTGTTQSEIRTVTSGANSSILDILDRTSLASLGKITDRSLQVHAISSLDDAIEVALDLSRQTPLAVYSFGDLPTCKYLLQSTSSYAGFANYIPLELLVGPASPTGHHLALFPRYPSRLFSAPRPKYAERTALSLQLSKILERRQIVLAEETELLKEVEVEGRGPVKLIHGYFETAALIGLATKVTPIVVGLGALIYLGVQKIGFRLTK